MELYPELTGRLRDTEDGGVKVVPTELDTQLTVQELPDVTLAQLAAAEFSAESMKQLSNAMHPAPLQKDLDDPIFVAHITRLADGGAVFGLAVHHCLADGAGEGANSNTTSKHCV
jgi:hypothetical protein